MSLIKERIQCYEDVLKKCPEVFAAVKQTEAAVGDMTCDQKLYLYGFVPVLFFYTQWILTDAKKRGVERIYFLARDGYPLFLMAKKMADARGLPEVRYLYVSRQSLRRGEFALLSDEQIADRVFGMAMQITPEMIFMRCGFSEGEKPKVLQTLAEGWTDAGMLRQNHVLSRRDICRCREAALKHTAFFDQIRIRAKAALPDTMGYYSQEGLLDDVTLAIADSGWIGTTQESLLRILQQERQDLRIHGYYFGLYDAPKMISDDFTTFYFSPDKGVRRKSRFCNNLYEALSSAPEGTTLRYERHKDQRVYPCLKDCCEDIEVVMRRMQTVEKFTEEFIRLEPDIENFDTPCRYEMTEELLELLMYRPTMCEVESFGNIKFCDDSTEQFFFDMARELSYADIRGQSLFSRILRELGGNRNNIVESPWIYGSLVRYHHRNKGTHRGGLAADIKRITRYRYLLYLRQEMWRCFIK